MSYSNKLAVSENLVLVFASTLMLTTRADVGARLVRRQYVTIAFLLMFCIGWASERVNPGPLLLFFSFYFLLQYFLHLFRRWREFRRGEPQHSYYLGTSGFDCRFVPESIRRNRKLERFFDPLVFGTSGFLVANFAPHIGFWVMVSSACLFALENIAWMREVHRQFDVSDGLVASGVQSQMVERFSPPSPQLNPKASNSGGIPTGLGADISARVRQSRAERTRASVSPAQPATANTNPHPIPSPQKAPATAAVWGLLLGGFGLGGYFRSWADFFIPSVLWVAVGVAATTKDRELWVCGPLTCAVYGYSRAVLFNWWRSYCATGATSPEMPPASTAPISASDPAALGAEARLNRLRELKRKDLISQSECDAKRQQILTEL